MKKFTLLSLLLITVSFTTYAQTERMALVEHFTQASCAPCATYNPVQEPYLQANQDRIISIKYQTDWPGVDPMNQHNPQDVQTRVDYYNIGGVPTPIVQGVDVGASANSLNDVFNAVQDKVDEVSDMASNVDIEIESHLSAGLDSIYITATLTPLADISGVLRAHVVVVENEIAFDTAPGSNGEKTFYNVMKKMLPSSSGTATGELTANTPYIINTSWKLANVYDPTELRVVVFLQNNTTKEVFNAGKAIPTYNSPYLNNAAAVKLTGIANTYCLGSTTSISPVIKLRNQGIAPLTSCEISYSINNGTASIYSWTGNLVTLESTEVTLPAIAAEVLSENNLIVNVYSPNGGIDEDYTNDVLETTMSGIGIEGYRLIFELKTDNYGDETSWRITDSNGTTFVSGNGYAANQTVSVDIDLPESADCYTLTVNDSYGDGMCCAYGQGYFRLKDDNGNILISGGEFGSQSNNDFSTGVNSCTAPILTTSVTPIPDNGSGSATVAVAGGGSGYTYLWSNGATSATISSSTPETYSVTVFDPTGLCSATTTVTITAAVGVVGVEEGIGAIRAYPNPTQNILQIELAQISETMQLQVTDIGGKILQTTSVAQGTTQTEISTANLPNGTYLFRLQSHKGTMSTGKFIVIH